MLVDIVQRNLLDHLVADWLTVDEAHWVNESIRMLIGHLL